MPAPSARTIAEYVDALNQLVQQRYQLPVHAAVDDIRVFAEFVTDAFSDDRPISKALTSAIAAPIHRGEFYHYTRAAAADSILRSQTLRLTSIQKRIGEEEISPFLLQFGYSYPLSLDENTGTARYLDSVANDIFYASFTDTNVTAERERQLWNVFAGSDGARLKFRLAVDSGCLRRMVYGRDINRWAQMFNDITQLTQTKLGRIFFWDDAATICALYLPEDYDAERETRLIIRRSWGLPVRSTGGFDYIEVAFGQNAQVALELWLLEVQSNNTGLAAVAPVKVTPRI